MVGFERDDMPPSGISQSLLWNTFCESLLAGLKPGVHHIRCYVAKMPDGAKADVFVDAVEWAEGSQHLRKIAEGLPESTAAKPVRALKQHLMVRPDDVAAAAAANERLQMAEWAASLDQRVSEQTRTRMADVLTALCVMGRYGAAPEQEQALIERGLTVHVAEALVSFLQSAAARVLLQGQAEFSETYFLVNQQTRKGIECRYDKTPEFAAGVEIFGKLREMKLAEPEIEFVASASAEMSGVRQALAERGSFSGGKFTQMMHSTTSQLVDGVDVDVLLARNALMARARQPPVARRPPTVPNRPIPLITKPKPWWRFW
jgi:hypothetical protein